MLFEPFCLSWGPCSPHDAHITLARKTFAPEFSTMSTILLVTSDAQSCHHLACYLSLFVFHGGLAPLMMLATAGSAKALCSCHLAFCSILRLQHLYLLSTFLAPSILPCSTSLVTKFCAPSTLPIVGFGQPLLVFPLPLLPPLIFMAPLCFSAPAFSSHADLASSSASWVPIAWTWHLLSLPQHHLVLIWPIYQLHVLPRTSHAYIMVARSFGQPKIAIQAVISPCHPSPGKLLKKKKIHFTLPFPTSSSILSWVCTSLLLSHMGRKNMQTIRAHLASCVKHPFPSRQCWCPNSAIPAPCILLGCKDEMPPDLHHLTWLWNLHIYNIPYPHVQHSSTLQ